MEKKQATILVIAAVVAIVGLWGAFGTDLMLSPQPQINHLRGEGLEAKTANPPTEIDPYTGVQTITCGQSYAYLAYGDAEKRIRTGSGIVVWPTETNPVYISPCVPMMSEEDKLSVKQQALDICNLRLESFASISDLFQCKKCNGINCLREESQEPCQIVSEWFGAVPVFSPWDDNRYDCFTIYQVTAEGKYKIKCNSPPNCVAP